VTIQESDTALGALSADVQQFVHRAFDDARADRALDQQELRRYAMASERRLSEASKGSDRKR
jgi:hypothetical protein